ncbi:nuclear transport factor 2 family protein [Phenylobacterium sp. LjRoot219]|uniref:nuclear transport factor 2 family protein n=1 Tax=Phenylobacterium sp. LjRoot219 TaxID=3342283 RepID=UPI003ECDC66F
MNDTAQAWAGPAVPPKTVEELLDHHAVCQLAKIYGLGLDLRDYQLARSAFAADAVAIGREGPEPIDVSLPKTYAVAESFHATQHLIGNQYVTLHGDEAVVWSYGVAHHKVAPGAARDEVIAGVQYRDRCRRIAGGWLITEREVVMQWLDMHPPRAGGTA